MREKGLCTIGVGRFSSGLTSIEMVFAVLVIAIMAGTYLFLVDSYRNRRMSEQAAKVLTQAARAQEDFFAKEHRYFDAEISGNGNDSFLVTPEGQKTTVEIPSKVHLTLKSKGKDKASFTGQAYYSGSKLMHKYDSETGKITTVPRSQEDS
jgi:Tfp pilus assembly protein PilE